MREVLMFLKLPSLIRFFCVCLNENAPVILEQAFALNMPRKIQSKQAHGKGDNAKLK